MLFVYDVSCGFEKESENRKTFFFGQIVFSDSWIFYVGCFFAVYRGSRGGGVSLHSKKKRK